MLNGLIKVKFEERFVYHMTKCIKIQVHIVYKWKRKMHIYIDEYLYRNN